MATLILDVGAGLNLLASRRAAVISAEVGVSFALEAGCAASCDLLQAEDGTLISGGLHAEIDAGVIKLIELTHAEPALYVRLAAAIGDQEAATLAIAHARGWGVLSDDPVLTRAASKLDRAVQVRTTAALLHAWARAASKCDVIEALRRIETHAAFIPTPADEWSGWWREQLTPTDAASGHS
jgi:hypothetical protein